MAISNKIINMNHHLHYTLIIAFTFLFPSILKCQDTVIAYNNSSSTVKTIILTDGTKVEIGPSSSLQIKDLSDSIKQISITGKAYVENRTKNKNAPHVKIGKFEVVSDAPCYYIESNEYSAPAVTLVNCSAATIIGKDSTLWIGTWVKIRYKEGEFISDPWSYEKYIKLAGWRIGIYNYDQIPLIHFIKEFENITGFKIIPENDIPNILVTLNSSEFAHPTSILNTLKKQKVIRQWKYGSDGYLVKFKS